MSCAGAAMCRLTESWSSCLLLIAVLLLVVPLRVGVRHGVQHPVVAVAQLEQRLGAVALERRAVHQRERVDVELARAAGSSARSTGVSAVGPPNCSASSAASTMSSVVVAALSPKRVNRSPQNSVRVVSS